MRPRPTPPDRFRSLRMDHTRLQLKRALKIHVVPGVDPRAAARDFLANGAVGIDDIAENMYDVIWDDILDVLGHVADETAIRRQRIETGIGPVFVLRDGTRWRASETRAAVLGMRGRPRDRN